MAGMARYGPARRAVSRLSFERREDAGVGRGRDELGRVSPGLPPMALTGGLSVNAGQFKRRRWLVPILVGISLTLLGAFFTVRHVQQETDERLKCQQLLKALHSQVYLRYRPAHDGSFPDLGLFPPDLKTSLMELEKHLAPGAPSHALFLKCPGSSTKQGRLDDAEQWQDYIYINWSRYYGSKAVPPDYPLIYDRRLSNHGGKGVNEVSVQGVVRWDPDATALKKFAAEHPEYEVPLPQ
jgi:hypothetical protein